MSEDMDEKTDKRDYLAEANAEAARRKRLLKQRAAEINALKAENELLKSERDTLATKLDKKPDDLRQELEAVKVKLREVKHKTAFEKVAKSLGANESALDDLFAVSGYKSESEEPDHEAIRMNVESVLSSKPYFKASKPESEAKPAATPLDAVFQAGLGLARGSTTMNSSYTVRESEIGSVLANPTKRDEYLKAFADKTLKIVAG